MELIAATEFEYKHRYILHGLIYALGFSVFWTKQWWHIGHNTTWLWLANGLQKMGFEITASLHVVLLIAIAFAIAGAALRWWGTAYLGASVVQRGSLHGDRVIADGPYRYVRNPLYLGTILHTMALGVLMQPAGAALVLVLITIFQLRLIAREESFLTRTIGPAYTEYCKRVPRLFPRLRSNVIHGGAIPNWGQPIFSEMYMVGTAISFAVLGWSYDTSRILQGVLVFCGLGLVMRAFVPHRG